MLETACQLCQAKQWKQLTHIEFGNWNKTKQDLQRDTNSYPVSLCRNCGHVQIAVCYDDKLLSQLYFHSHQEAILWDESLIGSSVPYQQMVSFFSEYLTPNSTLVDFGCGMGDLLLAAKSNQPKSNLKLVGVDFNNRINNKNISYLSADLNAMGTIKDELWPKGIDVACASHVLEHLVNPVDFLNYITKRLSKNGKLFIEVPNFSSLHDASTSGLNHLINLQHIHYYTADSISQIARQSGLKVEKIKQFTTGYIPRLQVLLTKSTLEAEIPPKVQQTATKSVLNTIKQSQIKRKSLAKIILQSSHDNSLTGLWGIGADFYLLIKENPEIANAIKSHQIELFDYGLEGHRYLLQTIRSSAEIPKFNSPVFMTPLFSATRIKMHLACQGWSVKPIDIFR